MKRRTFNTLLPLGAMAAMTNISERWFSASKDSVYDSAVVIDGLIIGRNWDEASFQALAETGYSGFNVSLDSFTFNRSLLSLVDWKQRVDAHPDRLIHATSAADFERAKKEGKVAVLFGFQNSRMINNDLENLDILYQAGTRWMQLTYNERNLIGDGCTCLLYTSDAADD